MAQQAAPQDAVLVKLNDDLNKTYLAFGAAGKEGLAQQEVQDRNAAAAGRATAGQRVAVKASINYRNDRWDLVDAVNFKAVRLEDLKAEDLPAAMQKMDLEERKTFVAEATRRRGEIQKQTADANKERDLFVAAATAKAAAEEAKAAAGKAGAPPPSAAHHGTLGGAMKKAVHEQAAAKSIEL